MDNVWTWFVNGISTLFTSLLNLEFIYQLNAGVLILINILFVIILNTFRRLKNAK